MTPYFFQMKIFFLFPNKELFRRTNCKILIKSFVTSHFLLNENLLKRIICMFKEIQLVIQSKNPFKKYLVFN